MKVQFYAVQDKKVGAFMPVFQMRSRGEAVRSFMDAVADEKSQLCKHYADYDLYQVAEFDDNTGVVVAVLELVMSGVSARVVPG